jgi:molybdate transport system substrate-binding protein
MPDGAVPVGRYAREWLAGLGLLAALEPRIVPTEHARATLAAVDAGHADAAILYATDARLARSARVAFAIPDDDQPTILYVAALSRSARPGAARLFEWLRGERARDALAIAGFAAP